MDEVLSFKRGRVPLLISMPHPGTRLTPAVDAGLVEEARALTDTDWHIPRLYDFAEELAPAPWLPTIRAMWSISTALPTTSRCTAPPLPACIRTPCSTAGRSTARHGAVRRGTHALPG